MSKERGYKIGRRDFLKGMGATGAAMALAPIVTAIDAAVLAAQTGYGLAADVQPVVTEDIIAFPGKGWLETSVPGRGKFITAEDGHKEYLRNLCLNNDILKDVVVKSFNNIFTRDINRPSYKLGEMLLEHVETAKKSIEEKKNTKDISWEDALHVAVLSLAAVLSPYLKLEELRKMGVNLTACYADDFPLLLLPEYQTKVPKIYPAPQKTCRPFSKRDKIANCDGGDRGDHAANNLAITYQFIYAKKYGLQDAELIPNGMKKALKFFENSIRRQAIVLDRFAQWFWEGKETKDTTFRKPGEYGKDEKGEVISAGFWDDKVWHDFKANELGLWAALELSKDDIKEEEIKEVARKLDYPSIYHILPVDGGLTLKDILNVFRPPQPPSPDVVIYANPDGIAALPVAA